VKRVEIEYAFNKTVRMTNFLFNNHYPKPMTGPIISYRNEIGDSPFIFKRKEIERFSDSLSQLTEIDFSQIVHDFSDEIIGIIRYLSKRKKELEIEHLSQREISALLTLNMVAAFALWFGFSKTQNYSKTLVEAEVNQVRISSSIRYTKSKVGNDYSAGIVIPVNITESDGNKLNKLENLIISLISWKKLTKLWIIGNISEYARNVLSRINSIELVNLVNDKGPASARNAGIEKSLEAGVDLVIFMDDDVVDPIDQTFELVCKNSVQGKNLVSPKFKSYGSTCFDYFHDIDGTLNGVYERDDTYRNLVYGTTCVMITPKGILEEGLRFDEDFPLAAGEDIDFCIRARANGHKIRAIDKLVIKHDYGYDKPEESLKKFVSRFVRYGEGNRLIKERHPEFFNSLNHALRRPTKSRPKSDLQISESVGNLSDIVARCLN